MMLSSFPLVWRTNLRGNLDLWPDVSANISTLCKFDGREYNEGEIIKAIPVSGGNKVPNDGRAIRNTVEIIALAGLGYKDDTTPPIYRLTNLGRCLFSFLGVIGQTRFVNDYNRYLLAEAFIRGLATVLEYRAIWELFLRAQNLLTNEELNRALYRLKYLSDIPIVAADIREARIKKDPLIIGPRAYQDSKFGTNEQLEQRKAINPLFLLAGGGKIFLQLDQTTEYRRLEDWAIPLIERQLAEPTPLLHGSTDKAVVTVISDFAALPASWGI